MNVTIETSTAILAVGCAAIGWALRAWREERRPAQEKKRELDAMDELIRAADERVEAERRAKLEELERMNAIHERERSTLTALSEQYFSEVHALRVMLHSRLRSIPAIPEPESVLSPEERESKLKEAIGREKTAFSADVQRLLDEGWSVEEARAFLNGESDEAPDRGTRLDRIVSESIQRNIGMP